jgi:hypothetical protein
VANASRSANAKRRHSDTGHSAPQFGIGSINRGHQTSVTSYRSFFHSRIDTRLTTPNPPRVTPKLRDDLRLDVDDVRVAAR